jgi:hypothetical protein
VVSQSDGHPGSILVREKEYEFSNFDVLHPPV